MVNLAGIVYLSTVDWYGKAAMVIFLRGCPLRCPHCHNAEFRTGETEVPLSRIGDIMRSAQGLISAVVLSGGEPLMQGAYADMIRKMAKALGYEAAVETSGFYPVGEWDHVFLDVKTSLRKDEYNSYVGDDRAFDNLVANLEVLDPKKTEIRVVLFKDSKYDLITLGILKGFPIRVLRGDVEEDTMLGFARLLAASMGCRVIDKSHWMALIGGE